MNMATNSFPVGLVVWIRLPPYPWWPGVIVSREDGEARLDAEYTLPPSTRYNRVVMFFNDDCNLAVAEVYNLLELVGSMTHLESAPRVHRKGVRAACVEAFDHIEQNGLETQKLTLRRYRRENEDIGLSTILKSRAFNEGINVKPMKDSAADVKDENVSKSVSMNDFPDGLVVWARDRHYPWWPGLVLNRAEGEARLDPKYSFPPATAHNRVIMFFNDLGKLDVIEVKDLIEFTANLKKTRSVPKMHRKRVRVAYAEAVDHIRREGMPRQKELLNRKVRPVTIKLDEGPRRASNRASSEPGNADELRNNGDDVVLRDANTAVRRKSLSGTAKDSASKVDVVDEFEQNGDVVKEEENSTGTQTSPSTKHITQFSRNRKRSSGQIGGQRSSWDGKRVKAISQLQRTGSRDNEPGDNHTVTSSGDVFDAVVLNADSYINDRQAIDRLQRELHLGQECASRKVLVKTIQVLSNKIFAMDVLLDSGIGRTLISVVDQLRPHAPEAAKELSDVLEKWRAQADAWMARASTLVESLRPPSVGGTSEQASSSNKHQKDTIIGTADEPAVADRKGSVSMAKELGRSVAGAAVEFIEDATRLSRMGDNVQCTKHRVLLTHAELLKNIHNLHVENISLTVGKKLVRTVEKLRPYSDEAANELLEVLREWIEQTNKAMLSLGTTANKESHVNMERNRPRSGKTEEGTLAQSDDAVDDGP